MVNQVAGSRFRASDLAPARVPVLFHADWCPYSRRFYALFRSRFPHGWAVDISDESDPLWDIHDVKVVPTVVLFEENEPVARWAGVLGERHAAEIEARAAPPA